MADPVPGARPDQPRPLPLRAALGGLKRGFAALGVRNYRLYWTGQVVSLDRHLDAAGQPAVAGPRARRNADPARLRGRPPVRPGHDAGAVRRRARRSDRQAPRPHRHPGRRRPPGARPVRPDRHRRGRDPDGPGHGLRASGLVNAVDMPLRQALAPDLVPRNLLANAIALNSMAFNSARVVGPALAGVIIAVGTSLTGSATAGVAVNLGDQHGDLRGGLHRPAAHEPARDPSARTAGAAPAGARQPARGDRLRGPHAARAVVPGAAGRHRRVRLQLPDPAAAVRDARSSSSGPRATARCSRPWASARWPGR